MLWAGLLDTICSGTAFGPPGCLGPSRQQQRLEGPGRPPRYDDEPTLAREHFTRSTRLAPRNFEQQRTAVPREVFALVAVLEIGFFGQMPARPDLAVRVRVGAAHHRTLVLEHLHPSVACAEFGRLVRPTVHHGAHFCRRKFRQGRRMVLRPADHAALTAHRLRGEERILPVARPRFVGRRRILQRGKIIGEHERSAIVGVHSAAGACRTRTEMAARIVRHPRRDGRLVHLSQPRPLRALRRHQHPAAGERIAATVRCRRGRRNHAAGPRMSAKPIQRERCPSRRLQTSAAITDEASTMTMKWM